MDTALIVAVVSGIIAVISASVTVWGSLFSASRSLKFEAAKEKARVEQEVGRYQEPFATAIYDLQSRIYNLVQGGFAPRFMAEGSLRERNYAIENTTFVFAQYFCCAELLRRGIHSSGHGVSLINHDAVHTQDLVSNTLATDRFGRRFLIFAGEQRAIGEALIQATPARTECMGYRQFLLEKSDGNDTMLDMLRGEIRDELVSTDQDNSRLRELHYLLILLLYHIDPLFRRFPKSHRKFLTGESRELPIIDKRSLIGG
jgi:hypothetical protein